jgi:hypothetical protein
MPQPEVILVYARYKVASTWTRLLHLALACTPAGLNGEETLGDGTILEYDDAHTTHDMFKSCRQSGSCSCLGAVHQE